MKVAIRYCTKTGNTKKLADAISRAIEVEALDISVPLTEDVDILFLGSSVYAAGVDRSVRDFISGISVNVGKVVNFSTAALISSTCRQVKKLVEQKGLKMSAEEFHCRGSFHFAHRGRPDDADCAKAAGFAKKICTR